MRPEPPEVTAIELEESDVSSVGVPTEAASVTSVGAPSELEVRGVGPGEAVIVDDVGVEPPEVR